MRPVKIGMSAALILLTFFHKTTRVLKELAATDKSKKVAADSLKSLREFWDKASKQFNDSQMDIQ